MNPNNVDASKNAADNLLKLKKSKNCRFVDVPPFSRLPISHHEWRAPAFKPKLMQIKMENSFIKQFLPANESLTIQWTSD